MLSRFEFENMGLSEKAANLENYKEPRSEVQMLMELLKSGSKDEQRMLAQALLKMGPARIKQVTCSQRRPINGSLPSHFRLLNPLPIVKFHTFKSII